MVARPLLHFRLTVFKWLLVLLNVADAAAALKSANVVHDTAEIDKADALAFLSLHLSSARLSSLALAGIAILSIVAVCGGIACILSCRGAKTHSTEEVESEILGMEAERSSIQQQVDQLEWKLEELRQEALKAHEEARRSEAEAAVAAAAAAAAAAACEDSQELVRLQTEAEAAQKAVEEQRLNAELTIEQFRQLADKAEKKSEEIKRMVIEDSEQAWHQLVSFARESIKLLTDQMEEVLASEASQDDVEALSRDVETAAGQALNMPLPLLLAGLLAPMQLRIMASWNWTMFLIQCPLLLAFSVAFLVDMGKSCGNNELWIWAVVMAAVLKANVSLRLLLVRSASAALADAKAEEDASKGTLTLGEDHDIVKFYKRVMTSSKDYFKLLRTHDRIKGYGATTFLSFMTFVLLVWGGAGTYLVITNAVIEDRRCDALVLRTISRIYAFFYVASLLWGLIALSLWVLELILTSKSLAYSVLEKAWAMDQQYSPSGFPVVSVCVRALILRSEKDMAKVEASILRGEILQLQETKAKLAKQEFNLDTAISVAEGRLKAAPGRSENVPTADELAALYSRDLEALTDKLAIFSLAIKVQLDTLRPSAMDAMEAVEGASATMLEKAKAQSISIAAAAHESVDDIAGLVQEKVHEAGLDDVSCGDIAHWASDEVQAAASKGQDLVDEALGTDPSKSSAEGGTQALLANLQSMADIAQQQAHEAGLDSVNYEQLAAGAKESARKFAIAALLQAREAGIDVQEMVSQGPDGNQAAEPTRSRQVRFQSKPFFAEEA